MRGSKESVQGQLAKRKGFHSFDELGILVCLAALCIVIGCINPTFVSWDNLLNVFRTTSYYIIIAAFATLVMIIGGLDLSVGSVMGLAGILVGVMIVNGVPVVLAIVLSMLLCMMIGIANGIISVKGKVPPLITTLGTLYIARGICNVITKGMPISSFPKEFLELGNGTLFGVPYSVYIAVGVVIIVGYILKNTVYGRSIYAVGGNQDTARLSGIQVDKIKISTYILTSLAAAFVGIIMASRLESAQVSLGEGWELTIIASIVIGGTSTAGGSGTILGTVIGALMMSIISNGMVLMSVSVYWQNIVVGAIIIFAVFIDIVRKQKAGLKV